MGNHDRPRVATRMGLEMIDMMNMLLLTLPGTPTCYAGDEIGMENVYYTFNETQDPYGRHYGPMVMCIYIIYLLSTLTCCCFIAPRTLIYLLSTLTCCCFIAPRTLNCLVFQSSDFERIWWWLFQKRVVRTEFDICVFIRYIYFWNLQFQHNTIFIKTKVLLPQA